MRRLLAKLALAGLGVGTAGCVSGLALASYVQSGAFTFYQQVPIAEWKPQPEYVASVETTDLQFRPSVDTVEEQTAFEAYSGAD